jgi:hypothetical protein
MTFLSCRCDVGDDAAVTDDERPSGRRKHPNGTAPKATRLVTRCGAVWSTRLRRHAFMGGYRHAGNDQGTAMKKSLIAVAAAGLIASGLATADTTVYRFGDGTVQRYTIQDDRHRDGSWDNNWRDDERQLSVDQRQARLQERIRRGFDNGRLTHEEARRMQRRLEQTEAKQRAYEGDGRLNRRETEALHVDLDTLAQRVRNQLRDEDRRY